ncbi:hypothetical protein A2118_02145 [Candidatus Kaiserbacteria bacterium GWA2_50_9]|uniref:Glycosyl transferase family 1 domain-containing protein n=1 Tax=Candidatus Kaiserbacteria bacterium GWA2_50_9 TaxID=1798474 RepID=A0A1F6BW21_9BACT|nr:MAG: hypothetical protein A2118_02145 [Candidatus Kaiserbacteria bacterium GWA2_50_9]
MIFDFDDAIYTHDFFKTKVLTHMADAVIVCSRALAVWAGQYNTQVHLFHTSLKFSAYATYTKDYTEDAKPAVIGWVGTANNHYDNLWFLAAVLRTLVAETDVPFTFVLVGAGGNKNIYELFEHIPGLQTEFIDSLEWNNPESVPQEIQKFDIGVMPLVDKGEWNLARSSFKPLEYMACGVATVSSAVGEITNVIQDGVNGYLADSENEWVEKLGRLISDRELCATLGKAGQEHVRAHDCYETIVPRMVELINSINRDV